MDPGQGDGKGYGGAVSEGVERGWECEAADRFGEAGVRRVQGFHLVLRILRGIFIIHMLSNCKGSYHF